MPIRGHVENAMYLHIDCFSLLRQNLHVIKWRCRCDVKIASVNFKIGLPISTDNMSEIHNGDTQQVASASASASRT